MTFTIQRLGHQGDGIAEGPIFAPRTLPDEIVDGVVEDKTLTKIKIQTPSEHRVKPPCRHYNSCGGCALQHASDGFVENWKKEIVVNALAAQDIAPPEISVFVSPSNSRRRAKFSGKRTKSGAIVGFHSRASGTVTEVPECMVISDGLKAGVPFLVKLTELVGSRKGEVQFLVTETLNGLDVYVMGAREIDAKEREEFSRLAASFGLCRLSWNDELIAGIEEPMVAFGSIAVQIPRGAFLQATPRAQDYMIERVIEHCAGANLIADLFSGCGTFSLPLAHQAQVLAVEGDKSMTDALDAGWRFSKGLKTVKTEVRDLYRRPLMPDELIKFDCVVLDPPRAGCQAQAIELAQSEVSRCVMVSCNPVTFARDLAILTEAGFVLEKLDVVDQFRWSPHIEVIGYLTR